MGMLRVALAAAIAVCAWGAAAADALPKTHLRIVGGLGGVSQFTNYEHPFWTSHIAAAFGGRVTAEVSAFNELGLRGTDVVRLLKLGAIEFGTFPLVFVAGEDPEAEAVDLAGLNPDVDTLRRTVDAWRPTLVDIFRARHDVEILAVLTYPAQVLYCAVPIRGLADLEGKKVRTAGISQTNFVEALGAAGVTTPFEAVHEALQRRIVDCAITGTLSGNAIGLPGVATHLHEAPLAWGVYVVAANGVAWRAVAPEVRALLVRELSGLEARAWAAVEDETLEGIRCNTGAKTCTAGQPGRMVLVRTSAEDRALRRRILADVVVPRWAVRCGARCMEAWNRTVAQIAGLPALAR